ncbi:hypothetical protein ACFLV8_01795 [Chloroflexota bacterium]
MPKFEYESEFSLKNALLQMGMLVAFSTGKAMTVSNRAAKPYMLPYINAYRTIIGANTTQYTTDGIRNYPAAV